MTKKLRQNEDDIANSGDYIKCHKGEVYYILNIYNDLNGDPRPGRPAVVVSNDHLAQTSDTVSVVYMTTKEKRPMPEHVTITGCGDPENPSTVLCEKICCVPKSRIGQFIRKLTPNEMERLDAALMLSLGIKVRVVESVDVGSVSNNNDDEIRKQTGETEFYRRMCDYLATQLKGASAQ